MPSWKGWSESEMRQSNRSAERPSMAPNATASTSSIESASSTIGRNSPPPPVVIGFTPINPPGVSPPPNQISDNASISLYNGQPDHVKTIASEYLGRGDAEVSIPAAPQTTRVTRASAARKQNTQPKKRAATANDAPASKRRKTSELSGSMSVAKPKQTKGKAATSASKQAEAKSKTSRQVGTNPPAEVKDALSSSPVSLFSSSTSMGTLSAPAQQTSFDAAKASRFGTTLYHGSQVAGETAASSLVSQPWLEAPVDKAPPNTIKDGNGAARHLRQIDVQAASGPQNRIPQTSTGRVVSSRTLSEEFIPTDGLEDDPALLDFIEASIQKTLEMTPGTTPQASIKQGKLNVSSIVKASKASSTSAMRSSRNWNEDFLIGDDADMNDLFNATSSLNASPDPQRRQTPLPQQGKVNKREVDENTDYGGALFSEAEKKILESLQAISDSAIKPIVRAPFPRPILDRSPLFGASSGTMLRTCFRVGEALKEGIAAIRSNHDIILELYARVTSSYREGKKQHFVFHDLYHDRPPYLEGTCELWNQSKLWQLDTRSFLATQKRTGGVMCRAVAKMKRRDAVESKVTGWRLEVLSIWEAAWDDVDFIAGIYGKERGEAAAEDE